VGALRAAQYVIHKQPGVYSMRDIVTEHNVLSHVYTEDGQAIVTLSCLPHASSCLSDIFDAIAKQNVFVDMISFSVLNGNSETVSFSLPQNQLAAAMNALKAVRLRYPGLDYYTMDRITKLTVEGAGMAIRHGVAAQVFSVLSQADIKLELVTTSETKISFCVSDTDVSSAVNAIAKFFSL